MKTHSPKLITKALFIALGVIPLAANAALTVQMQSTPSMHDGQPHLSADGGRLFIERAIHNDSNSDYHIVGERTELVRLDGSVIKQFDADDMVTVHPDSSSSPMQQYIDIGKDIPDGVYTLRYSVEESPLYAIDKTPYFGHADMTFSKGPAHLKGKGVMLGAVMPTYGKPLNGQYSVNPINLYAQSLFELGMGLNVTTGQELPTALQTGYNTQYKSKKKSQPYIAIISDFSDSRDYSKAKAGFSGVLDMFSGGMSGSHISEKTYKSNHKYMVSNEFVQLGFHQISEQSDKLKLEEGALRTLLGITDGKAFKDITIEDVKFDGDGVNNFINSYGHYYISGFSYGGSFQATYDFKYSNNFSKKSNKISANLKGSWESGSLDSFTAEFKKESENRQIHAAVTVSAHADGDVIDLDGSDDSGKGMSKIAIAKSNWVKKINALTIKNVDQLQALAMTAKPFGSLYQISELIQGRIHLPGNKTLNFDPSKKQLKNIGFFYPSIETGVYSNYLAQQFSLLTLVNNIDTALANEGYLYKDYEGKLTNLKSFAYRDRAYNSKLDLYHLVDDAGKPTFYTDAVHYRNDYKVLTSYTDLDVTFVYQLKQFVYPLNLNEQVPGPIASVTDKGLNCNSPAPGHGAGTIDCIILLDEKGLSVSVTSSMTKESEILSMDWDKIKQVSGQNAIFFDDHEGLYRQFKSNDSESQSLAVWPVNKPYTIFVPKRY